MIYSLFLLIIQGKTLSLLQKNLEKLHLYDKNISVPILTGH